MIGSHLSHSSSFIIGLCIYRHIFGLYYHLVYIYIHSVWIAVMNRYFNFVANNGSNSSVLVASYLCYVDLLGILLLLDVSRLLTEIPG